MAVRDCQKCVGLHNDGGAVHCVQAEALPLQPTSSEDRNRPKTTRDYTYSPQLIEYTLQQSRSDMAEAAGLALGVVGVVGVIGAFKEAIDLFAVLASPRQFSRDYEVIITKLDIEKMMLLQWADRVRLLHSDYDERLTDVDIGMGIRRTLRCLRMLMGDARQLDKRYGVTRIPIHEATELPAPISQARMARFAADFGNRMLWEDAAHPRSATYNLCEIPKPKSTNSSTTVRGTRAEQFVTEFLDHQTTEAARRRCPSMSTKFRWAIKDKEKFESLVAEIAYFTAKLNQLVPPKYPLYFQDVSADISSKVEKDSRDLPSISDLRSIETILGAPLASYEASSGTKYDLERRKDTLSNKVLDVIWFRMIDDRRDGVREAHSTTLDWVLRTPDAGALWDDMSQWMLSGSGIYWICGKAGSGKSTLMKHLLFHPEVPALLSRWSRGDPCVLGSFFFLNLGHPLQKSQDGLSRAVLYQLLYSWPQLIPEMLPRMWKDVQHLRDGEDLSLPTTSEIAHAMKVFALLHGARKKFCFFIDGIDELQGDYLEGISFIKKLTANGYAKAIVSSRPIPECILALKHCPQLKLEDLNREDISKYVDDTIAQHSYMLKLLQQSPRQAAEIVQDLVDKSSGVFLWVVLACRSLISGFADCDRLPELRQRVDELPSELYELFDLMMGRIKRRHKEEGAKLLRTFHAYKQDEGQKPSQNPISAISLAQLEEELSNVYRQLTAAERLERCEDTAGRLRSRTGGLLELQVHENRRQNALDEADYLVMEFMHRTVFEFLEDPNVWTLPSLRIADKTYVEASLISILKLRDCIRLLDHGDSKWHEGTAWSVFSEGLDWGARADQWWPVKCGNIFCEIECFLAMPVVKRLRGSYFPRFTFIHDHDTRKEHSHATLLLAIERGAVNFTKRHPALFDMTRATSFPCCCVPLYRFASSDFLSSPGENVRGHHAIMVQALLEAGGNPNFATSPGDSPWRIWLSRMEKCWRDLCVESQLAAVDMTISFLEAGADMSFHGSPVMDWFHRVFSSDSRYADPEIRQKLETLRQVMLKLEHRKLGDKTINVGVQNLIISQ